jgi:GTP cyclohydrolase I
VKALSALPSAASMIDVSRAERAVHELLSALGADTGSESLRDTPARVARMYAELLAPAPVSLTTFPNDEHYDELVIARDIPVYSLCEHHLLPFHGVAHVAYIPANRIVGLSKLARVVDLFAGRLQVQERLTRQVAELLWQELEPRGVGVVIEAEHMCMTMRGVRKPGARTATSALLGLVRTDPRTRDEFLSLARRA